MFCTKLCSTEEEWSDESVENVVDGPKSLNPKHKEKFVDEIFAPMKTLKGSFRHQKSFEIHVDQIKSFEEEEKWHWKARNTQINTKSFSCAFGLQILVTGVPENLVQTMTQVLVESPLQKMQ